MKKTISYSACEKYNTCPAMYKYHYIDRVRSKRVSSALFFGKAIDDGISRILLEKKKELTLEELELLSKPEYEVFLQSFSSFSHNGNIVSPEDECCDYFKLDYGDIDDNTATLISKKYKKKEEILKLNKIAASNLRELAKIILSEYRNQVLPEIDEVISIQEKVILPNEKGDEIIGFIDFIGKFINDDNVYIIDNKTSSSFSYYKKGCVENSTQLGTYCEYKDNNYAAYIVINKNLYKKDPKIKIKIIKGKVDNKTIDNAFQKYENLVESLDSGKFEKNYDSKCFFYGKPCIYYKYCRSDKKDMTDLIKLE